ncbi:MAG: hypothetical protein OEY07_18800 [Gammaproteobacteria bacterium]|nr:hypothetical protein [Gammaproteobacteria bacterium]
MAKDSENSTLLASLKKLFSELAAVLSQIRISSYHKFVQTDQNFDITSVLDRQVDELAAGLVKQKPHSREILDDDHQHKKEHKTAEEKEVKGEEIESDSRTENEFARHIAQRKFSSVSQPYIGDQLTARAWEHIHSAVRYAGLGDVDTAKLHVKIAGQALEEASHFLSEKDYSELIFQVERYFVDTHKP